MVLPKLLREFCLTTSMKGVPRIVRSQSIILRGLWLVSVLSFLGVSIMMTYYLIAEYLAYPKITTITEETMNVSDPLLPNVMVCNSNPISSNFSQIPGVPDMQEFHQFVTNLTRCEGCSVQEDQDMDTLREELLTTQGYYQYIGKQSARKIGHQQDNFVVKCHVLSLEGPSLRRRPCDTFVDISQLVTPEYFNCYIFQLHSKPGVSLYGLSLILYLDNFLEYEMPYFNTLTDSGQATGVKTLVYEANSLPMFMSEAFDLPPGMYSTIHLKGERRDRLSEPWGNCASKNQQKETFLGSSIEYTAEGCFVLCTEENITETCKCKDEWFSGYLDDVYHEKYKNTPYCMEFSKGLSHLKQKLECIRKIRTVAFQDCLLKCPLPCHDMIYHTIVTQSKWPSKIQHKAFYDTIIRDKPYAVHFPSPYTAENNAPYSADKSSGSDQLSQAIYDNFVKMNIFFGDYRFLHLQEMQKLSLSELLSQMGGTLNLWSGITVILLIELLDLLYQAIASLKQRELKQETEEEKRACGEGKGTISMDKYKM